MKKIYLFVAGSSEKYSHPGSTLETKLHILWPQGKKSQQETRYQAIDVSVGVVSLPHQG